MATEILATTSGQLYETDAVYATAHDDTDGFVSQDGNTIEVNNSLAGGVYYVYRNGLVFDTSAITGGILSAKISVYGVDVNIAFSDFDIVIVSGADLVDVFVSADYGELLNEVTSFGSLSASSFNIGAWNDITLNSQGIAAINKGGTTRFGIRNSKDIDNVTPNNWCYAQYRGQYIGFGINYYPRLTIVPAIGYSQAQIIG